jgi:hypothetical protein
MGVISGAGIVSPPEYVGIPNVISSLGRILPVDPTGGVSARTFRWYLASNIVMKLRYSGKLKAVQRADIFHSFGGKAWIPSFQTGEICGINTWVYPDSKYQSPKKLRRGLKSSYGTKWLFNGILLRKCCNASN